MRGMEDHNVPVFNRAAAALRADGHEVFNPADGMEDEDDTTVDGCRRIFSFDTSWICEQADIVAVLPGWEHSLGAQAEISLAKAIGLQVKYICGDITLEDEPWTC